MVRSDPDLIKSANKPVRKTLYGQEEITHPLLQTWVDSISYDWRSRIGHVWCGGPVDMDGAIDLFKAIDEGVSLILTYIDGVPDTSYIKRAGNWSVSREGHT